MWRVVVLIDEFLIVGDGILIRPGFHLESVVMLVEALLFAGLVCLKLSVVATSVRDVLLLYRVFEEPIEVLSALCLRVPWGKEERLREECPIRHQRGAEVRYQMLFHLRLMWAR